jgi:hypothetical protein
MYHLLLQSVALHFARRMYLCVLYGHNLGMCVCVYRRSMDWILDLLTLCTHHSELQVITALSPVSTLYKSPQHPLRLFQPAGTGHSQAKASNNGDTSASSSQVLLLQPPVQNSCQFPELTSATYQLSTNCRAISSQSPLQNSADCQPPTLSQPSS